MPRAPDTFAIAVIVRGARQQADPVELGLRGDRAAPGRQPATWAVIAALSDADRVPFPPCTTRSRTRRRIACTSPSEPSPLHERDRLLGVALSLPQTAGLDAQLLADRKTSGVVAARLIPTAERRSEGTCFP
jgi:hypothetical protein